MMQPQEIHVALVHRDGLYRDCLRHCLGQAGHISIVHSASGIDLGIWNAVGACRPDLVILEFALCRRQAKSQSAEAMPAAPLGIKLLVVGVPNREEDILSCIESEGAAGYLLMDATLADLMNNIKAVMNGETLCSPRVASLAFGRVSALTRQIETRPVGYRAHLTKREAEIVRLIDNGLSNKEIAVHLHIEVSTVKNHVHNILDKLQLHSRHSAVRHIKEQAMACDRF